MTRARTADERNLDADAADQAPYSAAIRVVLYPPAEDESFDARLRRAIADLIIERL